MLDVNETQVGGNHYQTKDQCWDFIIENGLGFLEGSILKYITRARKKHASPVEDYKKALHIVQKMISVDQARDPAFTFIVVAPQAYTTHRARVKNYAANNGLSFSEEKVLQFVLINRELVTAVTVLENMIRSHCDE